MQTSVLSLAANELAAVHADLAERGLTLSLAALAGATEFVEWKHYPRRDKADEATGYEFYYHSHAASETPTGEHGHFHLFKRDGEQPNSFCHLIGISLDQKGLPVRLFTTNQWVTGEVLADAKSVIKYLHHFDLAARGRLGPVVRWLRALTKLYATEMAALANERDRKLSELVVKHGCRSSVLADERYSVLTECKINLMNCLSKYLMVSN